MAEHGRWRKLAVTSLLALAALSFIWWHQRQASGWRTPDLSQPLPSLGADLWFIDVPALSRRGPSRLVVLRLAKNSRLVPYHSDTLALPSQPQAIEAWAARLGAPVVFNSGQFDPQMQYLGLLKSRGRWLSAQRQGTFMGLLVSGPLSLRAQRQGLHSRIVDLAAPPWRDVPLQSVVDGWDNVVQSMMLVDDAAQVRVRRSELAACRTVVAQDRQGRLLLVFTEGAVTLHELARWLAKSPLQIERAMNLDGGFESQLALRTPELQLTLYGQYGGGRVLQGAPMVHVPLPAVIAVEPGGALPR